MKCLISSNWLYKNYKKNNIILLDCSWYMHNVQRSGYKDYKLEHLPNSHFIDIDHISDKKNDLPHMIPQKNISKTIRTILKNYLMFVLVTSYQILFFHPQQLFMEILEKII